MDKNGKISGTPVWLSIKDMEYIVKHLPSPPRRPQWENIEELKVKLRLKLGDLRRYNEVEI